MQPVMAPNILQREEKTARNNLWVWASYGLMLALGFAVFYALAQRDHSDISIHATWAAEASLLHPRSFLHHVAHPLWHGLVVLAMGFGLSKTLAAALVTALLKGTELWLVNRLFVAYLPEKTDRGWIALAAFCCTMVGTLRQAARNPNIYVGVGGTPNTWHSPTQITAMVLMVLCVTYTAHCYMEFQRLLPKDGANTRLPLKKAVTLGVLLFVSLLAKPTFMQAFLPAASFYFLAQWLRHPKNSRFFLQILAAVAPAVLFMVVQYMYYFGIIVPHQSSMALELSWLKFVGGLDMAWLMQVFPLYVLCVFIRREQWKDPLVPLTVLLSLVATLENAILGETGTRAADGNFGWGLMGAAFMLWVVMTAFFCRAWVQDRARGKLGWLGWAKYGVGAGLFLWHLGSGVYYVIYLLTSSHVL